MSCSSCGKSKSPLACGLCQSELCKDCAQYLDEDTFSFLAKVPTHLKHTTYCYSCFSEKVEPDLQSYEQVMEQAKNIMVFDKKQSKETRLMSRKERFIQVVDCADRQETLLRLAFMAAQSGFNAIIDVEIDGKKVKTGAYQTTSYSGKAVPCDVDDRKLLKDRSLKNYPN